MGHEPTNTRRLSAAAWLGLAFAMTFPTVMAAIYFLALGGGEKANPAQQLAYSVGKIVQFTFPLAFVLVADRRWPRPHRPTSDGLALGLGFGVLVACAMLGLYFGWLANSALLASTPALVRGKMFEFHITTPSAYFGLAAFIVVVHSLLEEYYWRWFIFDRLSRGLGDDSAAVVSGLAFMGHHVVVLHVYFPGQFLTAVVPFSLGIAVGGMVWAWLFRRHRLPLGDVAESPDRRRDDFRDRLGFADAGRRPGMRKDRPRPPTGRPRTLSRVNRRRPPPPRRCGPGGAAGRAGRPGSGPATRWGGACVGGRPSPAATRPSRRPVPRRAPVCRRA